MNFLLQYLNTAIIGLFVTVLISSCYLLSRFNSNSSRGRKAPEAAGKWPVIGHLPLLAGPQLPHLTLGDLADKYGPVFSIRIGLYPALVVSSWEVAKELFTTFDVDISSRPKLTVGKLLGHNYVNFGFSPYGAYWREMRKITAAELLSNRRLELFKHVQATEVELAVKDIYKLWSKSRNEASHVLVETKQWFGDLILNVILRMVAGKRYFGADAAADEKEVRRCRKAMREFFDLAGLFVVRDALPFLGWLDIGGYEKAMKKTHKELDSLVEEWLQEHRRKKEAGETAAKEEQDFIDMLLSVLDDVDLSGFDIDTVIKSTCSVLLFFLHLSSTEF